MSNPNLFTKTRIPNAISVKIPVSQARNYYTLSKVHPNNIYNNISIGIRKSLYQYDRNLFYNGLTPGDNGYLNDGGIWSTSATATSLYYLGLPFEWWDGYVVYCYDPNDPNPQSGGDDIEIYTASDLFDLAILTNQLTGFPIKNPLTNDYFPEGDYLHKLGEPNFLCVNTHYPDITFDKNTYVIGNDLFVNSLRLLIDFGFIPSYSRGGGLAYDISGNKSNTMTINSSTYSYISSTMSNCAGGCLSMTSPGFASISYNQELNSTSCTINTWVKFNNINDQVLIDNYDSSTNTGWQLIITGGQFAFLYNSSNIHASIVPTTDTWYNIMCSFDLANITISVSDSSNFAISTDSASVTTQILATNPVDFKIMAFDGYISLISLYDKMIGYQNLEELWSAYTMTSPNRYNLIGTFANPAPSAQFLKSQGIATSGWYYIQTSTMTSPKLVYCNMEDEGGGWMLMTYNPDLNSTYGNIYPNVWVGGQGSFNTLTTYTYSTLNNYSINPPLVVSGEWLSIDIRDIWYDNGVAQCSEVMRMSSTNTNKLPLLSNMEVAHKVSYSNPNNLKISATFSYHLSGTNWDTTNTPSLNNLTSLNGIWTDIIGYPTNLNGVSLSVTAPGDWMLTVNSQWSICDSYSNSPYPVPDPNVGTPQEFESHHNIGANLDVSGRMWHMKTPSNPGPYHNPGLVSDAQIYGFADVSVGTDSKRLDLRTYAIYVR